MPVIEIEITSKQNHSLLFAPAQQKLRGRVDFVRMKEKEAFDHAQRYPRGIPGLVVGFDPETGEAFIRDRLDEPEWADVKRQIEKTGQTSEPRRALGGHCSHGPTMLHWMRRAVQGGFAEVITGRLPEVIEGEPVTDFYRTREPDKQGEAVKPLKMLLGLLYAKLGSKEKAEFKDAMEAIG